MSDQILLTLNIMMIIINIINLEKSIKYKAKGLMILTLIAIVLLSSSSVLCLRSIFSLE